MNMSPVSAQEARDVQIWFNQIQLVLLFLFSDIIYIHWTHNKAADYKLYTYIFIFKWTELTGSLVFFLPFSLWTVVTFFLVSFTAAVFHAAVIIYVWDIEARTSKKNFFFLPKINSQLNWVISQRCHDIRRGLVVVLWLRGRHTMYSTL